MMSTEAKNPVMTPIPVQLSEHEFTEFIFPHLSMPKRGPKCKLGYHRLFNLILWVLYTGMQWKCLPIPKGPTGKPAIHYTNVYRAFAKWADDGSLQQAFIASVGHLSDEKRLDVRVLHGDGTNTVAKKGEMASGTLGINTRRARKSSRSQTTMAMCCRPFPSLQSMKRIWCFYLMD
jgi:transposase